MKNDISLQESIAEMGNGNIEKKISRIRKVANELYEKNGELTAKDLLDEARSEASEVHDCFPWDDEDLAEKARIWLANQYIARIKVRFVDEGDEESKSQRVFRVVKVAYTESGEKKEKQVYKRIDDVLVSEPLRKQVVADLIMRQEYWAKEASDFRELKNIVNAKELARIKSML